MSLNDTLMQDMKKAMKEKDKETLTVVRSLKAALMNYKIKAGHDLTDEDDLSVLSSALKQRKESLEEFTKAKRDDLIAQTNKEIEIIEKYMPKQMTSEELEKTVEETIAQVGASSKKDFGKVMQALMPKIKGRADGKAASSIVGKKLN
ncbi:GatB/YqeY domain-containing protein [Lactobacillus hominis]|uniref:GatB/Yqey family protein n=1 Tax=Lactobacillus hominis DSM 23910 = CRBIP 24.179 TaxID=1423758 RepID=I7JVC3_9LACO|nr:GatB/YqeY domain-containing protein [Lactobacillus hominis]KRM85030.1 GatB Yqey family protein [Lactobacillus hominis DSM 23910 = CRBIP 24.179]MCT3348429.1 GatB/YqeY domain-containing protein [Lactobacillus hominis]CCI82586.1 GatB/Yqey family protein [Lactobacillus hominis DSM 23910 = CRBIP 24.179]